MAKQAYVWDGTQWVPVGSQGAEGTAGSDADAITQVFLLMGI